MTGTKYIALGAAILLAIGIILYYLPGDQANTDIALNKLKIATGFTLLALVFLYGLSVLVYIANGQIDLSKLLNETDGGASMSRFQLLIFTLVIALSLFLVTVKNMAFPPTIPPEILTLLGISASTYAVSKGIQMSGPNSSQDADSGGKTDNVVVKTDNVVVKPNVVVEKPNVVVEKPNVIVEKPNGDGE